MVIFGGASVYASVPLGVRQTLSNTQFFGASSCVSQVESVHFAKIRPAVAMRGVVAACCSGDEGGLASERAALWRQAVLRLQVDVRVGLRE